MNFTIFSVFLTLSIAVSAFSASEYSVITIKTGEGVFLHTLKNGSIQKKQLVGNEYGTFGESPDADQEDIMAQFSPDGNFVAFSLKNNLYVLKNDGSNVVKANTGGVTVKDFEWTSNGIVWIRDSRVMRYVYPENKTYTGSVDLSTIATPCPLNAASYNKGYSANQKFMTDITGTKFWLNGSYSSNTDSMTCASEKRGSYAYVVFNPDYSNYTLTGFGTEWGHGRIMSNEGFVMFTQRGGDALGDHHFFRTVVWFDQTTPPTVVYGRPNDDGKFLPHSGGASPDLKPEVDPPFSNATQTRVHAKVVNNKDLICSNKGSGGAVIYAWKSNPTIEVANFSSVNTTDYLEVVTHGWEGPLPTGGVGISPVGSPGNGGPTSIKVVFYKTGNLLTLSKPLKHVKVSLHDLQGRMVFSVQGDNTDHVTWSQGILSHGYYLASIQGLSVSGTSVNLSESVLIR